MDFSGKNVTVIGLGVSNTPLVRWLLDHGASVTARDRKSADQLSDQARELISSGVKLISGDGYLSGLDGDYIFRTPGLRYDTPEIAAKTFCKKRGLTFTS